MYFSSFKYYWDVFKYKYKILPAILTFKYKYKYKYWKKVFKYD